MPVVFGAFIFTTKSTKRVIAGLGLGNGVDAASKLA